jgi:hypothetical protein
MERQKLDLFTNIQSSSKEKLKEINEISKMNEQSAKDQK